MFYPTISIEKVAISICVFLNMGTLQIIQFSSFFKIYHPCVWGFPNLRARQRSNLDHLIFINYQS